MTLHFDTLFFNPQDFTQSLQRITPILQLTFDCLKHPPINTFVQKNRGSQKKIYPQKEALESLDFLDLLVLWDSINTLLHTHAQGGHKKTQPFIPQDAFWQLQTASFGQPQLTGESLFQPEFERFMQHWIVQALKLEMHGIRHHTYQLFYLLKKISQVLAQNSFIATNPDLPFEPLLALYEKTLKAPTQPWFSFFLNLSHRGHPLIKDIYSPMAKEQLPWSKMSTPSSADFLKETLCVVFFNLLHQTSFGQLPAEERTKLLPVQWFLFQSSPKLLKLYSEHYSLDAQQSVDLKKQLLKQLLQQQCLPIPAAFNCSEQSVLAEMLKINGAKQLHFPPLLEALTFLNKVLGAQRRHNDTLAPTLSSFVVQKLSFLGATQSPFIYLLPTFQKMSLPEKILLLEQHVQSTLHLFTPKVQLCFFALAHLERAFPNQTFDFSISQKQTEQLDTLLWASLAQGIPKPLFTMLLNVLPAAMSQTFCKRSFAASTSNNIFMHVLEKLEPKAQEIKHTELLFNIVAHYPNVQQRKEAILQLYNKVSEEAQAQLLSLSSKLLTPKDLSALEGQILHNTAAPVHSGRKPTPNRMRL